MYASNTLNAHSLHLHIYDRCGVCARLTWLFLEVCTHLYSTDTLTRAHTHCDQCKPDSLFPPPHRYLWLDGNQLACVPLTAQAREAITTYLAPSTLCAIITCEAGKFSTVCSPRCSNVDHQHRPVMHVFFLAKYMSMTCANGCKCEMPEPNMRMTFAIPDSLIHGTRID
jgi:hypothetical protein